MNKQVAIGIDIGGTNTKVGIITHHGELIDSLHFPTEKDHPEHFFKSIYEETLKKLKAHHISNEDILGIGLGAPMLDSQTGIIGYAHNLGWRNIPIRDIFQQYFKLPIFIDNDANLAALGESYFGVGKNAHSFILITLGTGVGTGIVINGKLLRGFHAQGGEGGHIIIDATENRPCPCGGINHVEGYLGAAGIKKTLQMNGLQMEVKEFGEHLHSKNPSSQALKCLDIICDQLSSAIINMAVMVDPEKFIIAGGVSQMGPIFLDTLEKKFNEKVLHSLKNKIQFELAEVSTKKGAIFGGAALVFSEVL